jgi:uncharacterized phage infection (PIP) family protein YhgE
MEQIVTSVQQVATIMNEIASASHEQSMGIEQINQAVTQMDEVTQQNAALVEEAAAAAQSMQDQAGNLLQVVSIFKLDDKAPPVRAVTLAMPGATARAVPTVRPASIAAPAGRSMPDTDWEEF